MPARRFPEKITYWAPGDTGDYGVAEDVAPVLIYGRWEDSQELFRDASGDEAQSVAVVYLDRPVRVDGYLVRGDFTSSTTRVADAREIKQVTAIRNMRYSDQENKAFL
jgi:hypothetical protein